jgi:hypothetical protein
VKIWDLPLNQQPCECDVHKGERAVRFRSIPYVVPTPQEWSEMKTGDEFCLWEAKQRKSSYASAYDFVFNFHLKQQFRQRQKVRHKAGNRGHSQLGESKYE